MTPRSPSFARICAGIAAIAACYVYFLIFAQFAFLRLAEADQLDAAEMRGIMGGMGAAGVLASLGIIRHLRIRNFRQYLEQFPFILSHALRRRGLLRGISSLGSIKNTATALKKPRTNPRRSQIIAPNQPENALIAGFALCATAAVLAITTTGFGARCGTAVLIGLGLGIATVVLAASAPLFFPRAQRGLHIGLGTGLAYALCNIPAVFAGTPLLQSWVALAACALGAVVILLCPAPGPLGKTSDFVSCADAPKRVSFLPLLLFFLALVWLDSAAFSMMQATPELNRFGWATPQLQWANAGIHLAAAIAAGMWLDRHKLTHLLATAYGCLATAALLTGFPQSVAAPATHWLYATGVSLYSVALVFTPSFAAGNAFRGSVFRAGVLYAVAGWGGSALGIGMAQDLHRIPLWFLGLSGGVIACSLFTAIRRHEI